MDSLSLSEALTVLTSDTQDVHTDKKAASYTTLACSLKSVSSNVPIPEAVFNQRNKLINCILIDSKEKDDAGLSSLAIQALGYILFNELVASCVEEQLAARIITVLLNVINQEQSTKQMCTRALWCLANHNLQNSIILPHIPNIITAIKKLTTIPLQTSSVAFETLNVLKKLYAQCKSDFLSLSDSWYSVLLCTLLTKHTRVQTKAVEFAELIEESLKGNTDLIHWLHKELRKNILPYINSKLTDETRMLRVWMHFVRILGKTLHRSGTFLNEMLKIVEAGFKNRLASVQIAAYKAWNVLIDDFALDTDIFTNQKRLRLLLMPLLSSAVKKRITDVDEARLSTWWHLIAKLLPVCTQSIKSRVFSEVCVPFLLFCIGLDPKSDLSQLSGSLDNPTHCHTPSQLYTLLSGARSSTPPSLYPFTPTSRLLNTGSEALLIFLGISDYEVESSFITDKASSGLSLHSFPFSILLSFLVFVEGYLHSNNNTVARKLLKNLVFHTILRVISVIRSAPDSNNDVEKKITLFAATDLLFRMKNSLTIQQLITIVSEMSSLGGEMCHTPFEAWPNVITLCIKLIIVHSNKMTTTEKSDVEQLCFCIINEVTANTANQSTQQTNEPYNFIVQCIEIQLNNEEFRMSEGDQTLVCRLWMKVGGVFDQFLMLCNACKKNNVHNINLEDDPEFSTIRRLLKFPFKHGFIQNDKAQVAIILDIWKKLLLNARIYTGLMVEKGANVCTLFVTEDLLVTLKQVSLSQYNVMVNSEVVAVSDAYQLDRYLNCMLQVTTILFEGLKLTSSEESVMATSSSFAISQVIEQCLKEINTLSNTDAIPVMDSPLTSLTAVSLLYNVIPCDDDTITKITKLLIQPLSVLAKMRVKELEKHQWKRQFFDKLGQLWKSLSSCYQTHYRKDFDTELLNLLSPLLEVIFLCKNEGTIKNTVEFWTNTFGKSSNLVYPHYLRQVLTTFTNTYKTRIQIPLPGFVPIPEGDVPITDMPSLIDQSEQESEPVVILPHPLSSPLRHDVLTTPPMNPITRKEPADKSFTADKEQEYVIIAPPSSKQTRILTEHQKERMSERPVLPTMYTTVEPSLNTQPFEVDEEMICESSNSTTGNSAHIILESPPNTNDNIQTNTTEEDANEEGVVSTDSNNSTRSGMTLASTTAIATARKNNTVTIPVLSPIPVPSPIESNPVLNPIPVSDPRLSSRTIIKSTVPLSVQVRSLPVPLSEKITSAIGTEQYEVLIESCDKSATPSKSPMPTSVQKSKRGRKKKRTNSTNKKFKDMDGDAPSDTPHDTPTDTPHDTPSDTPHDTPTDKPIDEPNVNACIEIPNTDTPTQAPITASSCVPNATPSDMPTDKYHEKDPRKRARESSDNLRLPAAKKRREDDVLQVSDDSSTSTPSPSKRKQDAPKQIVKTTGEHQHVIIIDSEPPPPKRGPVTRQSSIPPLQTSSIVSGDNTDQQVQQLIDNLKDQLGLNALPGSSVSSSNTLSSVISNSPNQSVTDIISKLSVPANMAVTSPALIRQILAAILKAKAMASPQAPMSKTRSQRGSKKSSTTKTSKSFAIANPPRPILSKASGTVTPMSFADNIKLLQDFLQSKSILPATTTNTSTPLPGQTPTTSSTPLPGQTPTTSSTPLPGQTATTSNTPLPVRTNNAIDIDTATEDHPLPGVARSVPEETNVTLANVTSTNALITRVEEVSEERVGQLIEPSVSQDECCENVTMKENGSCMNTSVSETTKERETNSAIESMEVDVAVTGTVPSLAHLALCVVDKNKQVSNDEFILNIKEVPSGHSPLVRSPDTPPCNQTETSARMTPIGILKYTSQFDTPLSLMKGRRVQFASPVVMGKQDAPPTPANEKEDSLKIVKTGRSRRRSPFSSRRTLQLSGYSTPFSGKINSATMLQSIVFPSLRSCQSPVEQILPALSPSGKFTHGLYNVVHARNISTVGNLSSLTENEVQSLPIKSPKLPVLRNALRNFEIKMIQGQKKKPSGKEDSLLVPKPFRLYESSQEENEEVPIIPFNSSDSQETLGKQASDSHVTSDNQSSHSHVTSDNQSSHSHVTSDNQSSHSHVTSDNQSSHSHVTSDDQPWPHDSSHVTSDNSLEQQVSNKAETATILQSNVLDSEGQQSFNHKISNGSNLRDDMFDDNSKMIIDSPTMDAATTTSVECNVTIALQPGLVVDHTHHSHTHSCVASSDLVTANGSQDNLPTITESLVTATGQDNLPTITESLVTATGQDNLPTITESLVTATGQDNLPTITESLVTATGQDNLPTITESLATATGQDNLPTITESDNLPTITESLVTATGQDNLPTITESLVTATGQDNLPTITESLATATGQDNLPTITESDNLPTITESDNLPTITESLVTATGQDNLPTITESDNLCTITESLATATGQDNLSTTTESLATATSNFIPTESLATATVNLLTTTESQDLFPYSSPDNKKTNVALSEIGDDDAINKSPLLDDHLNVSTNETFTQGVIMEKACVQTSSSTSNAADISMSNNEDDGDGDNTVDTTPILTSSPSVRQCEEALSRVELDAFSERFNNMFLKMKQPSFMEQFDDQALDSFLDNCLTLTRAIHFRKS